MGAIRVVLILSILLVTIGNLEADTFPVTKTADTDDGTCDPDCSLREAIGAANANVGADDVPIPAGTYLLTLGALILSDDATITGAGQESTIIDGNASDRVFEIQASVLAEISGFTIQNGSALWGGGIRNSGDLTLTNTTVSGNTAYAAGGGIRNSGDLTLTNSTVSGNTVSGPHGGGGGIWNDWLATQLILTDSTVSGNTATYYGGGIANSGDLTLTNTTVSGNTAYDFGGGIDSWGDLTLTNSTVSGNSASGSYGVGGGIYNYFYLTLTNSTVSGNSASSYGGGIYNALESIATLTDSTVSGNTASGSYGVGGGIWNVWELALTNSTVSGNSASSYGGGIYNHLHLILNNSTVSGNTAYYGGGGIYNSSGSGSGAWIANTIVAGNSANCSGPDMTSLGYNLTDDTSCGFTAPGDLVVADAMLGPLQDNGGPTETHDLLPGSPAIAAGSPDCPPPDTDQRGVARPQGARCDIGAVEYVPEPGRWLMLIAGLGSLVALRRVGRRT